VYNNGIFLTSNNGTSWAMASESGLWAAWIHSLVVSGNNIFAGTNGGVFLSTNNGASWTAVDSELNIF